MRNFATVFGSKLDESILRKAEEKKSCVACDGTLNGRTRVHARTHAKETPSRDAQRTTNTSKRRVKRIMGIPLSKNHRSNENIDRAFKNGSSFHPSFEVEDVVKNNGGSLKDSTDAKKSIDSCANFLNKATGKSVSVSEEEVKDLHAEVVLKTHVIDEKNFLGVPTALDENDMDSPLSHYFINSR